MSSSGPLKIVVLTMKLAITVHRSGRPLRWKPRRQTRCTTALDDAALHEVSPKRSRDTFAASDQGDRPDEHASPAHEVRIIELVTTEIKRRADIIGVFLCAPLDSDGLPRVAARLIEAHKRLAGLRRSAAAGPERSMALLATETTEDVTKSDLKTA